jgi:uncharacterized protein YjbI with pentapeptide repeats
VRDAWDLGFLNECLSKGHVGRDNWKKERESDPNDHGFEAIMEPLTDTLENGVKVSLSPPHLQLAELPGVDLSGYDLSGVFLSGAVLKGSKFRGADLSGAHLILSDFSGADLRGADLSRANLLDANLSGADLSDASLVGALLLRTNIENANLDRCNVHGVSVWGARGEPRSQKDLAITTVAEPTITVDDIEVGQFVYLMLNNRKIRNVLQVITSKVVLLLGRFTSERKALLDRVRDQLRQMNFSPVLFDFEPASSLDISDTVTLLARMARFVIADLTDPRSVQQELTMIAPNVVVAIQPILLAGQEPWSMFPDLARRSRGILPIQRYRDADDLLARLRTHVIGPAEAKRSELLSFAAGGDI